MRLFQLVQLEYTSIWHRFRHDWSRELAAFICSFVLVGLFSYIFSDFLNEKLRIIGPSAQAKLIYLGYLVLWSLGGVALGVIWRLRLGSPMLAAALRMGETSQQVKSALIITILIDAFVCLGVIWLLVVEFMGFFWPARGEPLISVVLAGVICIIPRKERAIDHSVARVDDLLTMRAALKNFRIHQLLRHNRIMAVWLKVCVFGSLLHALIPFFHFPGFLNGLLAIILTTMAGLPVFVQLKEDLKFAWAERLMGVSHKHLVGAYYHLGGIWAFIVAGFGSMALALGMWGDFDNTLLLRVFLISLIGPLAAPALMFQLEPRRPAISLLALFFINLFLGTAIIVHPISIILLSFLIYYANGYQMNRYYRA